jgi:hypothetical protein
MSQRKSQLLTDKELSAQASKIRLDYFRTFPNAFNNDEREFDNLLMFFSPRPVPLGLTAEEIRTCVALYKIIKKQITDTDKALLINEIPSWGNMVSRRAFRRTILALLEEMAK